MVEGATGGVEGGAKLGDNGGKSEVNEGVGLIEGALRDVMGELRGSKGGCGAPFLLRSGL
jgi:hypothetical protein